MRLYQKNKIMSLCTCVLAVFVFSYSQLLSASESKVIETFEAGPIKGTERKVVKVQTRFEWSQKNPCPCNGENPPCIKTFLDPNLPPGPPRDVEVPMEINNSTQKYEGSNLVPVITEESSVRLITVPFCRQSS